MLFEATERRNQNTKSERSEEVNAFDPTYDTQFDFHFHGLNSQGSNSDYSSWLNILDTYKMLHVNWSIPNKILIFSVSIRWAEISEQVKSWQSNQSKYTVDKTDLFLDSLVSSSKSLEYKEYIGKYALGVTAQLMSSTFPRWGLLSTPLS